MIAPKTWIHELMLTAARGEATQRLVASESAKRVHAALLVAGRHGVGGWMARELRDTPGLDQTMKIQMQAVIAKTLGNHRRRVQEAQIALGALSAADIPALVIKGPSLVERYYGDPALRFYSDVDIVVPPDRLRAAIEVLEAGGFGLLDANWPLIIADLRGQVHLHSEGVGTIDLHWHLVNDARKRRTLHMRADEMWPETIDGTVGDARSRLLATADDIAYVCLHAALAGCHRFLWLLDVKHMAASPDVDWDQVGRRMRRWRFAAGGYLVLALAREFADAAVPLETLRAIKPGGLTMSEFRSLLARWDLSSESGGRLRQLFFATAGDDVTTRARLAYETVVPSPGRYMAMADEGRFFTLRRVTTGTVSRIRNKLGDDDDLAGKEFEPVGDRAEGRERYLRLVEEFANR
ncbi:MAG: nucleotidyltransferase family protein [Actinomycetota bacterium]